MSAPKSCIFHVGTVKTGSTSIQKCLWESRQGLLAKGIDYVQVTPPRLDLPRYTNVDFLFNPRTDFAVARVLMEQSPAERLLFSEEGLWGRPHAMLHPVFDGLAKTVVLYLRNPAELIASWAAENAEPYNAVVPVDNDLPPESAKGPLPIEVGLRQLRNLYDEIFMRFLGFLDTFLASGGHAVVRPFEVDRLTEGDVTNDFLELLGLAPDALQAEGAVWANPSRSRKFCDVSACVWEIAKERGAQRLYGLPLVASIHDACRSGDDRPVVATLSDQCLAALCEEFAYVERGLSERVCPGQAIMGTKMPRVFGKPRPPLVPIDRKEIEGLFDREIRRLQSDSSQPEP